MESLKHYLGGLRSHLYKVYFSRESEMSLSMRSLFYSCLAEAEIIELAATKVPLTTSLFALGTSLLITETMWNVSEYFNPQNLLASLE